MTELQREIEIAEWLSIAIGNKKKPIEKWGLGEVPVAGLLLGIRSLAENERHHEAVENLLAQIRDRLPTSFVTVVP
jgi:hypothetical protein